LDELIAECAEELQAGSKKHRIIIKGDTNIQIHADKNRLEQVIINLVANAIKYSPDADNVIIDVQKVDEGIKISVTDFGIGIPAENVPLIFDRFYRVDENSQRYAGLGLGLYISSEIIRQHQSHINIESTVGEGSTFWFIIPFTT
jgi:two-component system CheB/CheR fusion protein